MPEFMAKLRKFENRSGSSYRSDVDRGAIIAARNNGMSFAKIAQEFAIPWGTARWIGTYQKTRFIDHSIIRARALEFLILTGPPRSGEILHTIWPEVDWDRKILTIPRKRMKVKTGEVGHLIPLTKRALEILLEMKALNDGTSDYVFFGSTQGRSLREREAVAAEHPGVAGLPLARTALNVFLHDKLKYDVYDVTVHGFRSTFTDWAYNCGSFREIAIELSLDHQYGSQTHRAYRRTQLVDERRQLLECWANYCGGMQADIIQLPAKRKTS
jgi:integrase